jgi:hypothetical protein
VIFFRLNNKNIIRNAPLITTASETISEFIAQKYNISKVKTLLNGFEEKLFSNLNNEKYDKFTISCIY